jgi:F-type H+-transporting ATPase subunit a
MRRLITWVIILALVAFLCGVLPRLLPSVLQPISVAPEPVFTVLGFPVTNSLLATLLADVVLIALFFAGTRNLKLVPEGLQNLLEALLEVLNNLMEQVAGAKARRIFPLAATIFLLVLVANWLELIPGIDNIGKVEVPHSPTIQGYEIATWGPFAYLTETKVEHKSEEAIHEAEALPLKERCHELGCIVVPYLRVPSTDLNFTLALGVISVVMTWYYGIRTLGRDYLARFFNVRGFKKSPIFGSIDFAVGFLELLSEFTRIISFTFRLFGNIFAGSVLIFVFSWLVPAIAPVIVYLLEIFVGAIQAFVFMMLTVVFIHLATISHGGEAHEGTHAPAAHGETA